MAPAPPLPLAPRRRRGSKSSSSGGLLALLEPDAWAHRGSLSLVAAAGFATLVTFTLINAYIHGLAPAPSPARLAGLAGGRHAGRGLAMAPPGGVFTVGPAAGERATPAPPFALRGGPPRAFAHPFSAPGFRPFKLAPKDTSPRCQSSKICDGEHSCGPDGLGCVTGARERQRRVREAIRWSWEGYRKYAWGDDEVDVLARSPMAWFKLGLTIVDGIDTLMIAGLEEEYQEARHWIANHLHFPDSSTVQFFEVNIRIMGGLLSAYYLSGGDELFLHKAEQLGDRLLPAFNTSSGLPITKVQLKGTPRERSKMARSDGQTNLAEAGTLSMEFTTLGRITGRDDFFNAGMIGWYALMAAKNISGLYCVGLSTARGDCYLNKLSVGSAADSMYEYMLKQWVMSNKTQDVPLALYKDAMAGMRKYLVRDFTDGDAAMSFVSEAMGDFKAGTVQPTNDHFEHLTCFVGGMLILGKWHGVSTDRDPFDHEDIALASRIGRACYELYRQSPSGVAPDSVRYTLAKGGNLPPKFPQPPAPPPRPGVARPAVAGAKAVAAAAAKAAPAAAAKAAQAAAAAKAVPAVAGIAVPVVAGRVVPAVRVASNGVRLPTAAAVPGATAAPAVAEKAAPAATGHRLDAAAGRPAAAVGRRVDTGHRLPVGRGVPLHPQRRRSLLALLEAADGGGAGGDEAHITMDAAAAAGAGEGAEAEVQAEAEAEGDAGGMLGVSAGAARRRLLQHGRKAGRHAAGRHGKAAHHAAGAHRGKGVQHVGGGEPAPHHAAAARAPDEFEDEGEGEDEEGEEAEEEEQQQPRRRGRHGGAAARRHRGGAEGEEEGGGGAGAHAAHAAHGGHGGGAKRRGHAPPRDEEEEGGGAGRGKRRRARRHGKRAAADEEEEEEEGEDEEGDYSDGGNYEDAGGRRRRGPRRRGRKRAPAGGRHAGKAGGRHGGDAGDEDEDEPARVWPVKEPAHGRGHGHAHAVHGDGRGAHETAGAPPAAPPPPPARPPPPPPPPAAPAPAPEARFVPLSKSDFLRPEAAETLFYLWRATGDEIYREWGWSMFRAWERWCKCPTGGYATVKDVYPIPPVLDKKMESFWLAETLKYLYLLFEDDGNVLPFDEWVLNTEAHPLPIWGTEPDRKALERMRERRRAAERLAAMEREEVLFETSLPDIPKRHAVTGPQGAKRAPPQS